MGDLSNYISDFNNRNAIYGFFKYNVLLIDDMFYLGERFGTYNSHSKSMLYSFLKKFLESGRTIIATSNIPMKEIDSNDFIDIKTLLMRNNTQINIMGSFANV